jgi:AcrR family transcriptional regulator
VAEIAAEKLRGQKAKGPKARARKGKDKRGLLKGGRREAILAAALEEFSARGFAAARLDDMAERAGVAKGTIYLYFRDKESLFQELVRSLLSPVVGAIEAAPAVDLPIRAVAEKIVDVFVREIYGTGRVFPRSPWSPTARSSPACFRRCARCSRARPSGGRSQAMYWCSFPSC